MQLLANQVPRTLSGTGILTADSKGLKLSIPNIQPQRQVKDMNMGLRKVIETSRTPAQQTCTRKDFISFIDIARKLPSIANGESVLWRDLLRNCWFWEHGERSVSSRKEWAAWP